MLKHIAVLFFTTISFLVVSQFDEADTALINKLNTECKALCPSSFEEAVKYADSSVRLAKKINYLQGVGYAYLYKGLAYDYAGDYDKAFEFYRKSGATFKKSKNLLGYYISEQYKGVAYLYLGEYDSAAVYFLESMPYFKKLNYNKGVSANLHNLGLISRTRGEYSKALEYYIESLTYKKKLKDVQGELNTNNNIVAIYIYLQDWKKALEWNNKCIQFAKQNNLTSTIAEIYTNHGFIYDGLGDFINSKKYYYLAMRNEGSFVDPSAKAVCYVGLSGVYLQELQLDSCRKYLDLGVQVLDQHENMEARIEAYELYVKLFTEMGDFRSALEYRNRYIDLYEEMANSANSETIKELEAKFNYLEQQEKIADLNRDKEIRNIELEQKEFNQRILMIAIGGVLLILVYIVYLYRNVKQQKRIADQALRENELLMKEIHHRVKNNLQLVSSLLYLQGEDIDDPIAVNALNDSRSRVETMAVIHQKLYGDRAILDISASEYIDDLLSGIMESYNMDEEEWEISKDIDDIPLNIDTTIPLALIINELITNSMKHGFSPNQEMKKLTVSLKLENQLLKLRVSDNGEGNEVSPNQSTGFGGRLIKMLAKKLRAEINVSKDNGYTTELIITKFKLNNE